MSTAHAGHFTWFHPAIHIPIKSQGLRALNRAASWLTTDTPAVGAPGGYYEQASMAREMYRL